MTVKGNMPAHYKRLKKLPWAEISATPAVSTDHGHRARRTIKAALASAWIEFADAAQVAQLRRAVTRKGKKTVEVACLITGDRDAGPATLAAWNRSHRETENKLHRVRDVTCQEDKSLVRTGNTPRVMASLRSLAISLLRLDGHTNIAAANRHHARDPQRTRPVDGHKTITNSSQAFLGFGPNPKAALRQGRERFLNLRTRCPRRKILPLFPPNIPHARDSRHGSDSFRGAASPAGYGPIRPRAATRSRPEGETCRPAWRILAAPEPGQERSGCAQHLANPSQETPPSFNFASTESAVHEIARPMTRS
jgi:predicted transposase YbfD/YdcC